MAGKEERDGPVEATGLEVAMTTAQVATLARWLLVLAAAVLLVVAARGGLYELVVVTVPGAPSESASVLAYRLNRLTGSVTVCDVEECDVISSGWLAWPGETSKREESPAGTAM